MNRILVSVGFLWTLFGIAFLAGNNPYSHDAIERTSLKEKSIAILINNDPAERHRLNLHLADKAIRKFGFSKIIIVGDADFAPSFDEVQQAMEAISSRDDDRVFLYLTGHGDRVVNAKNPQGIPCFRAADRPVMPDFLVQYLKEKSGVIYDDQCYSPLFLQALRSSLQNRFYMLSDKNESDLTASCRSASPKLWESLRMHPCHTDWMKTTLSVWRIACPLGMVIQPDSSAAME